MAEAMKNPSMAGMLNNPDMLENCIKMMKGNPMMLDMLSK